MPLCLGEGLLGWRRPFRAVRQIGQKWATCTPGMLYIQGLMDPTVSWGTLGAHLAAAKGAGGARVGGGVNVVTRKQH